MDNVAIIVDELKMSIGFFQELGLLLEGEMAVEGSWVDRTVAINGVQNDVAMMQLENGQT